MLFVTILTNNVAKTVTSIAAKVVAVHVLLLLLLQLLEVAVGIMCVCLSFSALLRSGIFSKVSVEFCGKREFEPKKGIY